MPAPKRVFISYSHKDDSLREELVTHLSGLKRSNLIAPWTDRAIEAGGEWDKAISDNLENADIILFLVSAAFLSSDYIWGVEVKRAMERHEESTARVIPIIVRTCEWKDAPFAKLQALPRDAKAVTKWSDRDEAWTQVVQGIRSVVAALPDRPAAGAASAASGTAPPGPSATARAGSGASAAPAAGVPASVAANRRLDPKTQLDVATTLQRVLRPARIPMENLALQAGMDLGHLRDDDWVGLVRAVHAGTHGPIGDGAAAVRKLVEAGLVFVPGSAELQQLLPLLG